VEHKGFPPSRLPDATHALPPGCARDGSPRAARNNRSASPTAPKIEASPTNEVSP